MSDTNQPQRPRAGRAARPQRFDLLEAALLCSLGILVGLVIAQSRWTELEAAFGRTFDNFTSEATQLQKAYGPETNSQYQEEWVLRDFFKGKPDGIFVDIGANDYRTYSNTYYLERSWDGPVSLSIRNSSLRPDIASIDRRHDSAHSLSETNRTNRHASIFNREIH